jgi:protein SDA1
VPLGAWDCARLSPRRSCPLNEVPLLQSNCKRDPESYQHEFELQQKHYEALLELFSIKPDQSSPELSDLILFLAHVSKCYPAQLQGFPEQLIALLDKHATSLQCALRLQLVQALILLRHKGVVTPELLLPVCFRLFQCHDKHLKATLHSFIITDIKNFNAKGCNDRLNRSIQNYMYKLIEVRASSLHTAPSRPRLRAICGYADIAPMLCVASHGCPCPSSPHTTPASRHATRCCTQGDSEAVAKRALAVLTELWRRQVWRDARTVNVIATAAAHPSPSIMLAALKFFLGQDVLADEDDGEAEDADAPAAPTKDDVYKAYHKARAPALPHRHSCCQ